MLLIQFRTRWLGFFSLNCQFVHKVKSHSSTLRKNSSRNLITNIIIIKLTVNQPKVESVAFTDYYFDKNFTFSCKY